MRPSMAACAARTKTDGRDPSRERHLRRNAASYIADSKHTPVGLKPYHTVVSSDYAKMCHGVLAFMAARFSALR
jgi:hypothetical protein